MAELDLFSQLENFEKESLAALEAVADENGLAQWKTAQLGKSSFVQQVFSKMKEASKEDRPKLGQAANKVRQALGKRKTGHHAPRTPPESGPSASGEPEYARDPGRSGSYGLPDLPHPGSGDR